MNTSAARELRTDASGSVRGFSLRTELCPVLCCSCRVHRQLTLPQPPHPAVFHAADDDFLFLSSEALTGNVRANENSRSQDHVIYSELARHSERWRFTARGLAESRPKTPSLLDTSPNRIDAALRRMQRRVRSRAHCSLATC